jgi:hypothetical protein
MLVCVLPPTVSVAGFPSAPYVTVSAPIVVASPALSYT